MLDVETEHFDLWLSREIELTRRSVGQLELNRNMPGAPKAVRFRAPAPEPSDQISKLTHVIGEPLHQLLEKVIQKLDASNDAIKHYSIAQTRLMQFFVQLRPTIHDLVAGNSLSMLSSSIAVEVIAQIRSDLEIALKIALLAIQNKESNGAKKNAALDTKQVERPQSMRAPKAKAIKRKTADCTLAELMKKEWPDGLPPNLKAPDRDRKINELSKSRGGSSSYSPRTMVRALEIYNAAPSDAKWREGASWRTNS